MARGWYAGLNQYQLVVTRNTQLWAWAPGPAQQESELPGMGQVAKGEGQGSLEGSTELRESSGGLPRH